MLRRLPIDSTPSALSDAPMPFMQRFVSGANQAFGPEGVRSLDRDAFEPGRSLALSARAAGIVEDQTTLEYIARWPGSMQEALRALLHHNLQRPTDERLPVTFAWAAAYDDEMQIWEVADGESRGGITIFLRSRYPADRTDAVRRMLLGQQEAPG